VKRNLWITLALTLNLSIVCGTALAQTCVGSIPDSAPDSRYQMNADGTVVDLQTGLMWMRCSMGQTWDSQQKACTGDTTSYTWQEALGEVQTLDQGTGFAGYTDWRLPNIRELTSITRFRCNDPAINSSAFPDTPSTYYWTSTPAASRYGQGWVVGFETGQATFAYYTNTGPIRLVRAGAFEATPPASTAP